MTLPFFPFTVTAKQASHSPLTPTRLPGDPLPSIFSEPSTGMPPPTAFTGYAHMQSDAPRTDQNGRNTSMGTSLQINSPLTPLPHAPPTAYLLIQSQPCKPYNISSLTKSGSSSTTKVFHIFKVPCVRYRSHGGSNTLPTEMQPDNSRRTLSNGARSACVQLRRYTSLTS